MTGQAHFSPLLAVALAATTSVSALSAEAWRPLFNGRDLEGWVVKVNHHPLGDNYRDTFQVKDGVLRASYDKYERFTDEFAHLIYRTPFAAYRLRFEYRFMGPATPGAPAWAVRNSGAMLHGQAPEAMGLDQSFPVSIEAQLLGGAGGEARPTGNVCTPGTTVSIDGVPLAQHCRNSKSPTYPEGQWVRFEVEVHGSRSVRQFVEGQAVMDYGDVRLAPAEYKGLNLDPKAAADLERKGPAALGSGYISLQGEGHPIEFRKIEIMQLRD